MAATLDMEESEYSSATLIAGRYRLDTCLGRGAFGVVYKALDQRNPDRRIAIKLLESSQISTSHAERFATECAALELLSPHPNIVTLYESGVDAGTHYMVMERIEGETLAAWLKARTAHSERTWPEVYVIIEQLCAALAIAHAVENPGAIVHRDLKPDNIMISTSKRGDLQVKLLDFHVARVGPRISELPGHRVGTAPYMAPEQAVGDHAHLGPAADIFSIGVIAVELLAGAPELPKSKQGTTGTNLSGTLLLRWLTTKRRDVPFAALTVIERALRSNPAERYPDAALLGEEWRQAQKAGSVSFGPIAMIGRHRWVTDTLAMLGPVSMALLTGIAVSPVSQTPYSLGLGRRAQPPNVQTPTDVLPAMHKDATGQESSRLRPRKQTRMRLLPGGHFRMGSSKLEAESAYYFCRAQMGNKCQRAEFDRELPVHEVELSSFWLDEHEVTAEQYAEWLNQTATKVQLKEERYVWLDGVPLVDLYPTFGASRGLQWQTTPKLQFSPPSAWEKRPMAQVSWFGARSYCKSQGMRLPTEAEWEFASRRGFGFQFPWGTSEPRCGAVVMGSSGQAKCDSGGPADVGTATQDRTPDGIRDLGGNVSEWVEDGFYQRYQDCSANGCKNPLREAPPSQRHHPRVQRGGSWAESAAVSRSGSRSQAAPQEMMQNVGFRCAADRNAHSEPAD